MNEYRPTVLIVDDQRLTRLHLIHLLGSGFRVLEADSFQSIKQTLTAHHVDLILLDLLMPDVNGYEVVEYLMASFRDIPIMIVTVSTHPEHIIQCLKKGVKDYLFKEDLEGKPSLLSERVLATLAERQFIQSCHSMCRQYYENLDVFIPSLGAYKDVYDQSVMAVKGGLSLLVEGETGVGKGTLVRHIHKLICPDRPLIHVNCGAISATLAESELFGHEKGAFTGAMELHKGKLEAAHGGILFLDEIGNLSLELQQKLLTSIESQSIVRVGGTVEIALNFRLICATNCDLTMAVSQGDFRQDLYYRIKQFPVRLPALRQVPSLIVAFLDYYIGAFNRHYGTTFELTDAERSFFMGRPWNGNIRELKNEIQTKVYLFSQGVRASSTPVLDKVTHAIQSTINDELNLIEKQRIEVVLRQADYNISKAARALNIHRSTLQGKLKKYDLYPDS